MSCTYIMLIKLFFFLVFSLDVFEFINKIIILYSFKCYSYGIQHYHYLNNYKLIAAFTRMHILYKLR